MNQAISKARLQSLAVQGEWDRVIELCQSVVRVDTSRADYHALLGKALVQRGDDSDAIAAFLEGIKHQPNQPDSHYALGTLYARQDKYARAIGHYQAALHFKPNWGQATFRLGTVFHRIGYSSRALEAYKMAILYDATLVEAHFSLALLYESQGAIRLAIKHYRQAIFLQPDLAKAHLFLSRALMRMNAYKAAADVCTHAIALLPEDASLRNNLGQILIENGQTQAAIVSYQQALKLDNQLLAAHQNLGRLCRNAQDLDQAASHFQQALQVASDNISLLNDYASLLIAKGEWSELIACFRQAVAQEPDWIAHYCNRTIHLSDQDLLFRLQRTCGRFLLALQQPESAATEQILKERLFQIYEYLGDFAIACDAPTKAEYAYRSALSIDPSALKLYKSLGRCLGLQGRKAAEIAIYQAGIVQIGLIQDDNQLATVTDIEAQQQAQTQLKQAFSETAAAIEPDRELMVKGVYRRYQDWKAASKNDLEAEESGSWCPVTRLAQPDPKCGGVTCLFCMSNLIRQFSPVQVGKQAFHCVPESSVSVSQFPTFLAEIENGRVWVAPQKSTWNVCNEMAIFTPDGFLVGDLSRDYPWNLPGCTRHDVTSHSVLRRQTPLPHVKQFSGRVAVLCGLSGHIYYHWMFDVLPRIEILKKSLQQQGKDLNDIDYFMLNGFDKAFQKETLAALNIPLNKVISSDVVPHLQADQLMVPSFAGHLDWVPPESIDFLRKVFLAKVPSGARRKRIYVTRDRAKYRHVFNETAVVKLLNQFGFESVAVETLSVAQQAQLFAEAEAIITPHGSGLTNLAFCSPDTTVIEFFSPHYMRTDYWMISQHLQLNHYYIIGESFQCQPLRQLMYPSGLSEDFSVDLSALRALIRIAGLTS